MRRALLLSLLLFVLSSAGLCFAHANVNRARDQVRLTETVLYGDKSAVQGITAHLSTRYDRHLFWNTAYSAGEPPETDTAFRFSARKVNDTPSIFYSGVYFDSYSNMYVYTDGRAPDDAEDVEYTGLSAAYAELLKDTPPGSERSKVILLSDYYDYYPLAVSIDLPGFRLDWNIAEDLSQGGQENPHSELLSAFSDFFRIPVLPDERIEIHASKSSDGHSFGYGGGPVDYAYYTSTSSTLSDNACFFTFGIHRDDGMTVDTSLIPGGYGIYCLPFEEGRGENGNSTYADFAGLSMVYPISREAALLKLSINLERTKLLLYTAEGGKYVLTVIDIATMSTLQRLEVLDIPDINSYYHLIYEGGDFVTVAVYGEGMAVLTVTDEGLYEPSLAVKLDSDAEAIYGYPQWNDVMDYDGERLVVSDFLRHEEYSYHTCGFYLAVYDKSGLIYYGEYDSSLDAGIMQSGYRYSDCCMPIDYNPLTVRLR